MIANLCRTSVLVLLLLQACKVSSDSDLKEPVPIDVPELSMRYWELAAAEFELVSSPTTLRPLPLMRGRGPSSFSDLWEDEGDDGLPPLPEGIGPYSYPKSLSTVADDSGVPRRQLTPLMRPRSPPPDKLPEASMVGATSAIENDWFKPPKEIKNFVELFASLRRATKGDKLGVNVKGAMVSYGDTHTSGGALNSGVYRISEGEVEVIARIEHYRSPTSAQIKAQVAMKGKAEVAQVISQETFTFEGNLYLGQRMEAGGADFHVLKMSHKGEALAVLRAGLLLNQNGLINVDAKPSNFVRKLAGGAMMIDHGEVKKVDSLAVNETLGAATYMPPEAIAPIASGRGPSYLEAQSALRALVAGKGSSSQLEQVNAWYHGHTIYAALTGDSINFHENIPKGIPYPSSSVLRAKLLAVAGGNPWVTVHVNDILSLLHPNPSQRAKLRLVLARLEAGKAGTAPSDWN